MTWAPLPPEAVWYQGRGFEDRDFDRERIPWHSFSFSHAHDFSDPDVQHRIIMPARNVAAFGETKLTANTIALRNGRVENQVPFHNTIEKTAGRPIQRLTITSADLPEHHGVAGNELRVFRPEIASKKAPVVAVVSPELANRHALEMQTLEKVQTDRQRALNEQHAQELKNPPPGVTKEKLVEQHKAELNAHQEQMNRERQLLQSQQAREAQIAAAPRVPPQRHINVPVPQVIQHQSNESRPSKSERQINAPVSQARSNEAPAKGKENNKESHDSQGR